MNLLICDRCGCTDKPFQGSPAAPKRGELKDGGGVVEIFRFHRVEGFDLCGPCFRIWLTRYQNLIESFLAGEEDSDKPEAKANK